MARAVTFNICFQIIDGYDHCFFRTLCKDDPQFFANACFPLQGKTGTGPVISVTPAKIDNSLLHNLVNIFFADLKAIHEANGVFRIREFRRMPFKSFLWPGLVLYS